MTRAPDSVPRCGGARSGWRGAILYATLVFRLRPLPRSIGRAYVMTLAYTFLLAAPANLVLDTNHLYLRAKPEGATLLDLFGPWPWYIGAAAVFALAVFLVIYSPFWVLDLWQARARRRR